MHTISLFITPAGSPNARHTAAPPAVSLAGAPARTSEVQPGRARLAFLDTLKVGLTVLVIAHHAGQAYGPTGGRWPVLEEVRSAVLGPFFAVNAAFFMGLFFFIAALFVPMSLERKGVGAFARDRALRLGVPLAVFAFGVFGGLAYLDYASDGGTLGYLDFMVRVYAGERRVDLGHLWFVAHLLVYSAVYAVWASASALPTRRREAGLDVAAVKTPVPAPTGLQIALATLGLGVVTFVVRIDHPIDRWTNVLGVLPVEGAHLPQYVALFIAGIVTARRGWLFTLPSRTGMIWLGVGLTAAALRYAVLLAPSLLDADGPALIAAGGAVTGALIWSVWEATICAGLSIGLITLLRDRVSTQGWLGREAAASAYGAYVLHVLPVVGLQGALEGFALAPLLKFALVTVVAVPLCFGTAALLRRVPGIRAVL